MRKKEGQRGRERDREVEAQVNTKSIDKKE